MPNPKIILASGSPRRKEILRLAGIPCQIIVSDADETAFGDPGDQVQKLALRKARAVFDVVQKEANPPIIIAADTLVFVNDGIRGKVLGKPRDELEAFDMLKTLQGRLHMVYTGVALLQGEYEHVFVDAARVYFRALSDEEILAYIATGEPFDKAGGYGVQERGAVLVDRIDGDFYTVMGLPISKVCRALTIMGYDIWMNDV
ncbi:MAG: Maf family protein [Defluviitaleaceae bacterium]|nr:Maf family protein [Defluviitaleaceae bacterium]